LEESCGERGNALASRQCHDRFAMGKGLQSGDPTTKRVRIQQDVTDAEKDLELARSKARKELDSGNGAPQTPGVSPPSQQGTERIGDSTNGSKYPPCHAIFQCALPHGFIFIVYNYQHCLWYCFQYSFYHLVEIRMELGQRLLQKHKR